MNHIILTTSTAGLGAPAPEGHVYLTIGPNCWGKGATAAEALQNAQREGPSQKRGVRFYTRIAPLEFEVNSIDGSVDVDGDHTRTCPHCTVGKDLRILTE